MEALVRAMSRKSLAQTNTKGNNVVHLAASRGNLLAIEVLMPLVQEKFGSAFEEQVLNVVNGNGKSCLDVASYNAKIATVLRRLGAKKLEADMGWCVLARWSRLVMGSRGSR